jgi:protein-tyrosine phosphatase
MKYGILFLLLGGLLGYYGVLLGGWGWFLFWPAASFSVVALGYLGLGARVFGKRADGTIAGFTLLVLFPYFLYTWTTWHLSRLLRNEDCYNEVSPGLYVGRRALAGELPTDVRAVADLTAEFPEPREVREGRHYMCLPTLDASVADGAEFRELVEEVLRAPGPVYVHCAEGHGRSGTVAAAVLLTKGLASDVEDAVAQLRKARPGVRLNGQQLALVTDVYRELPPGSRPG